MFVQTRLVFSGPVIINNYYIALIQICMYICLSACLSVCLSVCPSLFFLCVHKITTTVRYCYTIRFFTEDERTGKQNTRCKYGCVITHQCDGCSYALLFKGDHDPDNKKECRFDWWSKYHASAHDDTKIQQEYITEGYDLLKV